MTAKRISRCSLVLASSLLAACAGNPSREAALLLVDQIDAYEEAIDEKIQAERSFYDEIRAALEASATRQAWVELEIERRNRITMLVDRAIVVDQGLQVSALQEFLRRENVLARQRSAAETQRREEIMERYRVSFESLAAQQRELSATRSRLLALAVDEDVADQLFEHIQNGAGLALELERQAEELETSGGE